MTSIPILVVSGYLGAGKTTLVNRLLTSESGRRIAAIVNDFGDIDIDATLLKSVSENLISLKNGCICCSLQGSLLATLSMVMSPRPPPEAIVIETSGISDPAEIVRALLDPIIFRAAALDTIVTLVDTRRLLDSPDLTEDSLWRAQVQAADFLILSKTDLVEQKDRESIGKMLRARRPVGAIFETMQAAVDSNVLFSRDIPHARSVPPFRPQSLPEFEAISWTSNSPLSLARFQQAVGEIAARTLRVKGLLTFAEHPERSMLFQCVGSRATLVASPAPLPDGLTAQLVLIGRQGELGLERVNQLLRPIELAGQSFSASK